MSDQPALFREKWWIDSDFLRDEAYFETSAEKHLLQTLMSKIGQRGKFWDQDDETAARQWCVCSVPTLRRARSRLKQLEVIAAEPIPGQKGWQRYWVLRQNFGNLKAPAQTPNSSPDHDHGDYELDQADHDHDQPENDTIDNQHHLQLTPQQITNSMDDEGGDLKMAGGRGSCLKAGMETEDLVNVDCVSELWQVVVAQKLLPKTDLWRLNFFALCCSIYRNSGAFRNPVGMLHAKLRQGQNAVLEQIDDEHDRRQAKQLIGQLERTPALAAVQADVCSENLFVVQGAALPVDPAPVALPEIAPSASTANRKSDLMRAMWRAGRGSSMSEHPYPAGDPLEPVPRQRATPPEISPEEQERFEKHRASQQALAQSLPPPAPPP